MTRAIRVRTEAMESLTKTLGLNATQAADRIGVKRQTFIRGMEGNNVSAAFVAGTLIGFGLKDFNQMFYTVAPEKQAA